MTAFNLARRYLDIHEVAGQADHPLIVWWLSLCHFGFNTHDETPWCSAFANGIAWELNLPRSESAMARSWLHVGRTVTLEEARSAYDVVILERGAAPAGHVGFYAGHSQSTVSLLAGNQGDKVSIAAFDRARILGIRRLSEDT